MKLRTNPAAGLIHDELEARSISAAKAARDMAIPRSRLSDIFAALWHAAPAVQRHLSWNSRRWLRGFCV